MGLLFDLIFGGNSSGENGSKAAEKKNSYSSCYSDDSEYWEECEEDFICPVCGEFIESGEAVCPCCGTPL